MTIKTQTISNISTQTLTDDTVVFDIETDFSSWGPRPILERSYAMALYDLGMHDTLKILDPKYDWVMSFKFDDVVRKNMLAHINQYPAFTTSWLKSKI